MCVLHMGAALAFFLSFHQSALIDEFILSLSA